ncbi:hypothetical protein [Halobaculum sp. P14]|uniref:hypothetical protein n=1 Tax=Halobaculum sp. P14 TaxID=3421638 RepID=UPI003EB72A3E
MTVIAHRVNTVEELQALPPEYGVEIDVRAYRDRLVLTHDPYEDAEPLDEYLAAMGDRFVVFNIKESGIEDDVRRLASRHGVSEYFLLDVEFPYIYASTRQSEFSSVAIRFSEAEPLEIALENQGYVDWVWVDTNTMLPLDEETYGALTDAGYRVCLVSPDRWGRPDDIERYIDELDGYGITLDAVMTSADNADRWQRHWS